MSPEKVPPPIPARKANSISTSKGSPGFVTAYIQQPSGTSNKMVDMKTSLRVPIMGGRKVHKIRRVPAERPTIATSQ